MVYLTFKSVNDAGLTQPSYTPARHGLYQCLYSLPDAYSQTLGIRRLIVAYTSTSYFTGCLISKRKPKSLIILVRFEQDLNHYKVFIHLMWQLFHEPVQSIKIDNQLLPGSTKPY